MKKRWLRINTMIRARRRRQHRRLQMMYQKMHTAGTVTTGLRKGDSTGTTYVLRTVTNSHQDPSM